MKTTTTRCPHCGSDKDCEHLFVHLNQTYGITVGGYAAERMHELRLAAAQRVLDHSRIDSPKSLPRSLAAYSTRIDSSLTLEAAVDLFDDYDLVISLLDALSESTVTPEALIDPDDVWRPEKIEPDLPRLLTEFLFGLR